MPSYPSVQDFCNLSQGQLVFGVPLDESAARLLVIWADQNNYDYQYDPLDPTSNDPEVVETLTAGSMVGVVIRNEYQRRIDINDPIGTMPDDAQNDPYNLMGLYEPSNIEIYAQSYKNWPTDDPEAPFDFDELLSIFAATDPTELNDQVDQALEQLAVVSSMSPYNLGNSLFQKLLQLAIDQMFGPNFDYEGACENTSNSIAMLRGGLSEQIISVVESLLDPIIQIIMLGEGAIHTWQDYVDSLGDKTSQQVKDELRATLIDFIMEKISRILNALMEIVQGFIAIPTQIAKFMASIANPLTIAPGMAIGAAIIQYIQVIGVRMADCLEMFLGLGIPAPQPLLVFVNIYAAIKSMADVIGYIIL